MTAFFKYCLWGIVLVIGWSDAKGQVRFGIELQPDQMTYVVSMETDETILPPFNITSSIQITLRMVHGTGDYVFEVGDLTPLIPDTEWINNVFIPAPIEAPGFDYLSFSLVSMATTLIPYESGTTVDLFSFVNNAAGCVGDLEIIDNEIDPFLPPSSINANIANSITVFGYGLINAYDGPIDDGVVPCVPEVPCVLSPVEQDITLCEGEDFEGYFLASDTIFQNHYFSWQGCDSIVISNIEVNESAIVFQEASVCLGEPYNGQIYFTDQTIPETFTTADGCDSTVLTYLSILSPVFLNLDSIVCYGDTILGFPVLNDTIIFDVFTAENGCDSVVNVQISTNQPIFFQNDTTICAGTAINGTVFVSDTTIVETLPTYDGCDSLFSQLEITILNPSFTTVELFLTEGDVFNGISIFNDTTFLEVFDVPNGCDSTVTTIIQVFPLNSIYIDTILCQGTFFQGLSIETDTILTDTISTNTTDSIFIFQVEVLPVVETILLEEICFGAMFSGQSYENDTTLIDIFTAYNGCDSIVTTQLTVLSSLASDEFLTICQGDQINGNAIFADTILIETFVSTTECDSVHQTIVEVLLPDTTNQSLSICQGDEWNGLTIMADTIIESQFLGALGCDSLVVTFIEVSDLPQPFIESSGDICDEQILLTTTEDFNTYLWNTGSQNSSIEVEESGTFNLTVTDQNGCSNSSTIDVDLNTIEVQFEVTPLSCTGDGNDGQIDFQNVSGGQPPYLYSIDEGNAFVMDTSFMNLNAGTYSLVVEDSEGCQWSSNTEIFQDGSPNLSIQGNDLLRLGESTQLVGQVVSGVADSISWTPSSTLNCSDCLQPIAQPTETTTYILMVTTEGGCTAEMSYTIGVINEYQLFLPNVFSPNEDGFNDYFYPQATESVESITAFRIYDRWGGLIFEQENILPNISEEGWNGKMNGQPVDSGNYLYYVEAKYINGKSHQFKGDVLILK